MKPIQKPKKIWTQEEVRDLIVKRELGVSEADLAIYFDVSVYAIGSKYYAATRDRPSFVKDYAGKVAHSAAAWLLSPKPAKAAPTETEYARQKKNVDLRVSRRQRLREQIESQRAQAQIRSTTQAQIRSTTALLCGDPPFERSALGKKLLGIDDAPAEKRPGVQPPLAITLPTRPFKLSRQKPETAPC